MTPRHPLVPLLSLVLVMSKGCAICFTGIISFHSQRLGECPFTAAEPELSSQRGSVNCPVVPNRRQGQGLNSDEE